MLRVGLTGNIGSGKSTVARIFSTLGIDVYHSDQESRKFLDQPEILHKLRLEFGDVILNPGGGIDKVILASIAFSDNSKLQKLNAMMHPLVMSDFEYWCNHHSSDQYVINEAAIIFESGISRVFDKIIHVSCPEETAIERVISRDKATRMDVVNRMKFQMKDEEKAIISDFVILNDGLEMLIPQVLRIHQAILQIES